MIENQATINDLTLRLDKERAKLDVDQAAKSRKEVINNNNDATRKRYCINTFKGYF